MYKSFRNTKLLEEKKILQFFSHNNCGVLSSWKFWIESSVGMKNFFFGHNHSIVSTVATAKQYVFFVRMMA